MFRLKVKIVSIHILHQSSIFITITSLKLLSKYFLLAKLLSFVTKLCFLLPVLGVRWPHSPCDHDDRSSQLCPVGSGQLVLLAGGGKYERG